MGGGTSSALAPNLTPVLNADGTEVATVTTGHVDWVVSGSTVGGRLAREVLDVLEARGHPNGQCGTEGRGDGGSWCPSLPHSCSVPAMGSPEP